jgi:hypothetical protein
LETELPQQIPDNRETMRTPHKNTLHSIDFESPQYEDMSSTFDDFFLIPSYFGATPDTW